MGLLVASCTYSPIADHETNQGTGIWGIYEIITQLNVFLLSYVFRVILRLKGISAYKVLNTANLHLDIPIDRTMGFTV